jgi:DNA-dependent RNA polymerase
MHYTGFQWLLIDAANQFGLDKLLFEERIKWAEDNLLKLEIFSDQAENKPLYVKAVMAIRSALEGKATGHLVGVDACCSGIQIMSAMTGCHAGAMATGLVDPNVRADAYSSATKLMQQELGNGFNVSRQDAKDALMTSFYGSKAKPKEIFGEDTPELNAFYKAAATVAPGAWELLQDLLASWQPYALKHEWTLPDGFHAQVKVMQTKEIRIEVDELDHASFTYDYKENEGAKKGLSNVANVTHSMDAYVVREMHRRCNYNHLSIEYVAGCIELEMLERLLYPGRTQLTVESDLYGWTISLDSKIPYYQNHYDRSGMASAVILPCIDVDTVRVLSTKHLEALASIAQSMLLHKPFPLITVHDEFKAHANNINHVREHYKEILAEIADSTVLNDLLSQIHGVPGQFNKLSNDLGDKIRGSAYALC